MRIPRKLNVCGIEYPVVQVDHIDPSTVENAEDGDVVYASFDRMGEQIEVRRDLPPQRKVIYLLHEVVHGLAEDIELDEGDTDLIAWRLYDFLKRNKFSVE